MSLDVAQAVQLASLTKELLHKLMTCRQVGWF